MNKDIKDRPRGHQDLCKVEVRAYKRAMKDKVKKLIKAEIEDQ
jgi:hypothetical protein